MGGAQSWVAAGVRWLRTLSVRQWLVGAFLLVLLASFPFGGLRAEETPAPPALVAGQPTTVEPFTVTITKVRHGNDLGVPQAGKIDGSYVAVFATVRSTSEDRSVPRFSALQELLRIEDVPGVAEGSFGTAAEGRSDDIAPDTVVVAADAEVMGDLAPHLTYQLVFIWHQAPGQPVPASVRVAAYSHVWRESSIDQTLDWRDPTRAAVGTFPTEQYVVKKAA